MTPIRFLTLRHVNLVAILPTQKVRPYFSPNSSFDINRRLTAGFVASAMLVAMSRLDRSARNWHIMGLACSPASLNTCALTLHRHSSTSALKLFLSIFSLRDAIVLLFQTSTSSKLLLVPPLALYSHRVVSPSSSFVIREPKSSF